MKKNGQLSWQPKCKSIDKYNCTSLCRRSALCLFPIALHRIGKRGVFKDGGFRTLGNFLLPHREHSKVTLDVHSASLMADQGGHTHS